MDFAIVAWARTCYKGQPDTDMILDSMLCKKKEYQGFSNRDIYLFQIKNVSKKRPIAVIYMGEREGYILDFYLEL